MRKKNPKNDPALSIMLKKFDEMENRLIRLETDMHWTKKILSQLEARIWALLAGILITLITALLGLLRVG
ncbi:MAG: hypothetical protein QXV39_08005 [Candidatus Caldarchaeum sp.]